ncbi:hypothetical protein HN587_02825 [Candidatus Woesearchaeota archaeon]|jgi:hypothetical protein|nr:hypothetical protein [Candidatus Woesearchaeota archaeon]
MKITKEQLLPFIHKAHRNTYAAPKEIREKNKVEIMKGHTSYRYVEGSLSYEDSYAGHLWAPGREVVFLNDEPIWCMSYQGKAKDGLDECFVSQVYGFLKKALDSCTEDVPFRGLHGFSEDDFEYRFIFEGTWEYFVGREQVLYKGEVVFFQDVMGSKII